MRTKVLLIALALLATLAAGAAAVARSSGRADTPSSRDFSADVDNKFFPLKPGTIYVYRGVRDGKPARGVVTVTHGTTTIAGASCVIVRDRLYLAGRLVERTTDYYTQDDHGNVWYFGEDTAELDKNGNVIRTEGSWRAGVGGAKPGIFMPAHPEVGQSFRQEFLKGHAEDHFKIIALLDTVTDPERKTALLTKEWTPLEPGAIDHKLYVRGIGTVVEGSVKGGNEHLELVSVSSES
jgi:hypothetical protein